MRRSNRVTPELRRQILERDGMCVLAIGDPSHVCRDIYGAIHRSDDLDRLTLEHVKDELMMGRRAPSDPQHMVALCGWANFMVPSKAVRERLRAHLREVNRETTI